MSELPGRVSASGRVTRVGANFAYITSAQYGGVFVPPIAVIPPNTPLIYVESVLKSGDIVHFTANLQQNPKNDCKYIATKVTVSLSASDVSGSETHANHTPTYGAPPMALLLAHDYMQLLDKIVGCVTELNETYGFVFAQSLDSSVFFPGSAYVSQLDPPRLPAHFAIGDMVLMTVRRQTPKGGCAYIAIGVDKIQHSTPLPGFPPTHGQIETTELMQQQQINSHKHSGVVSLMTEDFGYIACDQLGSVYFQKCSLVDCEIVENSSVDFVVTPQIEKNGCRWRAVRVTCKRDIGPCVHTQTEPVTVYSRPCVTIDKSSDALPIVKAECVPIACVQSEGMQTPMSPQDLLIYAITNRPEVMDYLNTKFPSLMSMCFGPNFRPCILQDVTNMCKT